MLPAISPRRTGWPLPAPPLDVLHHMSEERPPVPQLAGRTAAADGVPRRLRADEPGGPGPVHHTGEPTISTGRGWLDRVAAISTTTPRRRLSQPLRVPTGRSSARRAPTTARPRPPTRPWPKCAARLWHVTGDDRATGLGRRDPDRVRAANARANPASHATLLLAAALLAEAVQIVVVGDEGTPGFTELFAAAAASAVPARSCSGWGPTSGGCRRPTRPPASPSPRPRRRLCLRRHHLRGPDRRAGDLRRDWPGPHGPAEGGEHGHIGSRRSSMAARKSWSYESLRRCRHPARARRWSSMRRSGSTSSTSTTEPGCTRAPCR